MKDNTILEGLKDLDIDGKIIDRKNIKEFIHKLEKQKNESVVLIETSRDIGIEEYKPKLQELFPGKDILYQVNPDLIFGVRITDNDNVYEFNLKSSMEKYHSFLKE